MKKIFAGLMAFAFFGTILITDISKDFLNFVSVSSEDTYLDCGIKYSINEDGNSVTGCDKNAEIIDIPNKIEGLKVTAIDDEAFSDCTNLTYLTISKYLKQIGDKAFYNCTKLKEVAIPSSVYEIGDYAFGYYMENNTNKKINNLTIYGLKESLAEK